MKTVFSMLWGCGAISDRLNPCNLYRTSAHIIKENCLIWVIHEILEWCVKFTQHRPHFKVLLNPYTGRISKCCRTHMRLFFLGISASHFFSASKSKAKFSSSEESIVFQNTELATFFSYSRLKKRIHSARATFM